MKMSLQRLSLEMIEASDHVQTWIGQFPAEKHAAAVNLLLKLRFVSTDTYSWWLKSMMRDVTADSCAMYAVSKIEASIDCLWDEHGDTIGRPSHSLGSEDLVNSVLANLKKESDRFLDHPGLSDLKRQRVKDIVLVEDSIGSGQRVSNYIALMMKHPTFRSWWSFGLIRLHVVAFSRTHEGEDLIRRSTPGSDHSKRKYPKSSKIDFRGYYAYHRYDFAGRWGDEYQTILALCDSMELIPSLIRRGFGGAMANIVFHHSVPDNLPSLLWFKNAEWQGLMPDRSVPLWLPVLLEKDYPKRNKTVLTEELISTLDMIRSGIRNASSLARALGLDHELMQQILASGRRLGLLTETNRLTKAGSDTVWANRRGPKAECFDRSLYIPKKWCVGQRTVQPFGKRGQSREFQTDSIDGLPSVDGEAG